eukprot:gene27689-31281_t
MAIKSRKHATPAFTPMNTLLAAMLLPMAATGAHAAEAGRRQRHRFGALADAWLPRLVLSPTIIASLVFVYGFIGLTAWLSLTESRMMPNFEYAGFGQYERLFDIERWWVSASNLGIFGGLFILFCLAIGLTMAILLDQRIRHEGALRAIYLYPMALSFIVTGAAWKWILPAAATPCK